MADQTTTVTNETAAPATGAEAPASPPEGGGVDWEGLNVGVAPGSDDDDYVEPEGSDGTPASTEPPQAKGTQTAQPKATPQEVPQTPPEGTPTEVTEPPKEGEEGEEIVPPTPPEPELTPEQKAQNETNYKEWRASMETQLEERYQFSEDEAAALQTEPERVLPKMAAKLFLDVQEAAVQSVLRFLPQAVTSVQQSSARDTAASQAFLSVNTDLADPKYASDIMEQARAFRARNPKASPQEAITKIGKMVRALHDLPPLDHKESPPPAAARTGTKRVATPPSPHRPATPGGATSRPAKAEPNVWADLASDDDD